MIGQSALSGWASANLGDVLQFNYGESLPERMRSGHGFPVYGSNGIIGYHDSSVTNGETIVVGRKGSAGEINFSAGRCFPIDTTYYVDQFHGMPSHYWLYLLQHLRLGDLDRATAVPGLNREDAYRIVVPVAPLSEQKRIADKLDALLARVAACRERLDRVPPILKRFRQAVLAAATSGGLTEDWREERGQNDNWPRHRIGEVTSKVGSGATPKGGETSYRTSGIPLIRSMNVIFHGFKREGLAFLDLEQADQLRNVEVDAKDVLLNITGASIGRVTLAPADLAGARVNQHVCIIRPTPVLLPEFLSSFLSAPIMQQVIGAENYGVTRQALTKQQILDFEVPVPPIDEQHEIVRRLEALFVFVNRLEARCLAARTQVERLTPSLLAKAFRGELVPQDPDDEPAAVLLERIRAARAIAAAQPKQPRRRPTMEPKTTTRRIPAGSTGIVYALQEAGRELSGKDLFAAAGYPPDADAEKVEGFFVAVRDALKQGQITRERRHDMDWFSLAPQ